MLLIVCVMCFIQCVCSQDVFQQVEFRQANLANPASAEKAFADCQFQIVFNLVAETKYGQSEQVGSRLHVM